MQDILFEQFPFILIMTIQTVYLKWSFHNSYNVFYNNDNNNKKNNNENFIYIILCLFTIVNLAYER